MKILVLASGGDAPGMNKIIYNLYKKYKKNIYACKEGFKGLIDGKIFPLQDFQPYYYKKQAGSCIKSSRCQKFMTEEGFKKGLKNSKKFDALIILGGNGSYKGAKRLSENGVKVIFVPSTIDNDVDISDYSLGFHTAVKACCDAIYNIMPSMKTFNRCCVFEVMGRRCDKIAKNVGAVANADYVVLNENDIDFEKISKVINKNYKNDKSSVVVIRENIMDINKFSNNLQLLSQDVEIKTFVVGHLQRGSKPLNLELKKANQFSKKVFKALKRKSFLNAVIFENGVCKVK